MPESPDHHRPNPPRRSAAGSVGFTLIEMMAVVVIMGLVFAIGVPRLGTSKYKILKQEAEAIAASLDFARQRAVMTARPHRLLIDLENGGYRIEWLATETEAFASVSEGEEDLQFEEPEILLGGQGPIVLRPPAHDDREFHPVPNRQFGAFSWIDDAVYFVGLSSPAGWIESGEVAIGFEADGTTEYSLLEIADSDDNHLTLEIEPMLDRVRRREGPARS